MRLLMMGPPACGKGTIGEILAKKLAIPLVSTGQLLRSLTPDSPFYTEMRTIMAKGLLAPNEEVAKILREEVKKEIYKNGYILDGWGRQQSDLEHFDPIFDAVILITVSEEISVQRISGRRICTLDNETYNIYTMTKEELAKCKGTLIQREDDTEEVVRKRLEIYRNQTIPVVEQFKRKGLLLEVNGEGTPQENFDRVWEQLSQKLHL